MNKVVNSLGLEAEFFLRGKNGKLLYPGKHGFSTDEFFILGEFRAKEGTNRQETLAHFMEKWYEVLFLAKKNGEKIDIETGHTEIDPALYADILRKMESKHIASAKNIYPKIDLLKLTDAVVKDGEIQKYNLSIGLHIHFSSTITDEQKTKRKEVTYSPVRIPLSIAGNSVAEMNLFQKDSEKEVETTLTASVSRITKPVLYNFIRELDEKILPAYKPEIPLKYRNPGFYELKSYGFEYRSLPFNKAVLDNIAEIVDFSYSLLEDLNI